MALKCDRTMIAIFLGVYIPAINSMKDFFSL